MNDGFKIQFDLMHLI